MTKNQEIKADAPPMDAPPPYAVATDGHPPPNIQQAMPTAAPAYTPAPGYPHVMGGTTVQIVQPPSVVYGVASQPRIAGSTTQTVILQGGFGPYPMQVTCSNCNATLMTETNASPGLLTWLLSGTLLMLGCWLGCCLVPCCIPECQDIEHRCANCKMHLGTYRRL